MSTIEVDQTVPSNTVLTKYFTLILNLCLMTKTDQDRLSFIPSSANQNETLATQLPPRENVKHQWLPA